MKRAGAFGARPLELQKDVTHHCGNHKSKDRDKQHDVVHIFMCNPFLW